MNLQARKDWMVPAALLALGSLNILFGVLQLESLWRPPLRNLGRVRDLF